MRSNKVKKLDKNAFNEAKTIEIIHLFDNEIEAIEDDTFSLMPSLKEINLEGNSIRRIGNRAFEHLANLVWLNLARNKLENIDGLILSGLNQLEVFNLENNCLSSIDMNTFDQAECDKLFSYNENLAKASPDVIFNLKRSVFLFYAISLLVLLKIQIEYTFLN